MKIREAITNLRNKAHAAAEHLKNVAMDLLKKIVSTLDDLVVFSAISLALAPATYMRPAGTIKTVANYAINYALSRWITNMIISPDANADRVSTAIGYAGALWSNVRPAEAC